MRLELVTYLDHYSEDEAWRPVSDAKAAEMKPLENVSVGWVASENDTCIRLVSNLDGDPDDAENCFSSFVILKVAILKRTVLGGVL